MLIVTIFGVAAFLWLSSSKQSSAAPISSTTYPVYAGPEREIGNRGSTLYSGTGIDEDSAGNLFITINGGSAAASHVLKTDSAGNYIKQFGGRIPGDDYQFSSFTVLDVVVDHADNVWVSDEAGHTIKKFDNDGNYLFTIGTFETYGTGDGQLRSPRDIRVDSSNNLYVADKDNHRIQKFDSNGNFIWKVGGLASGNTDTTFNHPTNLAINSSDVIYVGDVDNSAIKKYDSDGNYLGLIPPAVGSGTLYCPAHPNFGSLRSMTFDPDDNLYVRAHSGPACDRIYKFDPTDAYTGIITSPDIEGRTIDSFIYNDTNMIIRSYDRIYPGTLNNHMVHINNLDGSLGTVSFGDGFGDGDLRKPNGVMAEDSSGNIFVSDTYNYRVQKFSATGDHIATFGEFGTASHQLNREITSIATDSTGNVYIASWVYDKILKFDNDGNYLTTIVPSSMPDTSVSAFGIRDLGIDDEDNIYVTTRSNSKQVYKLDENGVFIHGIGDDHGSVSYFEIHDDEVYLASAASTSNYSMRIFSTDNQLDRFFSLRMPSTVPGTDFRGTPLTDFKLDSFRNIYMFGSYLPSTSLTRLGVMTNDGRYLYSEDIKISPQNVFAINISNQTDEMMINGFYDYIRVRSISEYINPPSAPLNVRASSPEDVKLLVEWDTPSDDGGSPITGYRIEVLPQGQSTWQHVAMAGADDRAATLNLAQGNFEVAVRAVNNAGESPQGTASDVPVDGLYGLSTMVPVTDSDGLFDFAFDDEGNMYATEGYGQQFKKYDPTGNLVYTIANPSSAIMGHITYGPDGNLYISDTSWLDTIYKYDTDGNLLDTITSTVNPGGALAYPSHVIFEDSGNILVMNQWYDIQRFDPSWNFIEYVATELDSPTAMTTDDDGNLYVANFSGDATDGIHKYSPAGDKLLHFGESGDGPGQFGNEFYSIEIDELGNIVVNDVWLYRVQVFSDEGVFLEQYGLGDDYESASYLTFADGEGMGQDDDGNMYIGDAWTEAPTYRVFSPTFTLDGGGTEPTISAPGAPTNLAQTKIDDTTITITWDPPLDDGGSPITGYELQYKKHDETTWQTVSLSPTEHSTTLENLEITDYDVVVTALNVEGAGPGSELSLSLDTEDGGPSDPDLGEPSAPGGGDGSGSAPGSAGSAGGDTPSGLVDTGTNTRLIAAAAAVLIGGPLVYLIRSVKRNT